MIPFIRKTNRLGVSPPASARHAFGVMLAVLGAALGSLLLATQVPGPSMAAPVAQELPAPSSCVATGRQAHEPSVVLGGESVRVTTTFQAQCPPSEMPLHLVLVLDSSQAMAGEPERDQRRLARLIVQRLNLKDRPRVKVAVVLHADGDAQTPCRLTNSSSQINSCIGRAGAAGEPALEEAFDRALRAFLDGRRDFQSPDELREAVLVFHGGPLEDAACGDALSSVGRLKGQGILVMTHCVSPGCQNECLEQLATSPRYALGDGDGTGASQILEQVIQNGTNTIITELALRARLAPDALLVPGSAEPPPNVVDTDGGTTLLWRTAFVPAGGLTVAWSMLPLERGRLALTEGIAAVFTDSQGLTGTLAYTDVAVTVLQPAPRPTATGQATEPATPTAEPATPSPEPATPTARATTPTDTTRRYVPALLRGAVLGAQAP